MKDLKGKLLTEAKIKEREVSFGNCRSAIAEPLSTTDQSSSDSACYGRTLSEASDGFINEAQLRAKYLDFSPLCIE